MMKMISLIISFAVLLIGFLVYGRVTEKIFAPDDRKTPAKEINDGVDCVPMSTWKAFLVQLLNKLLTVIPTDCLNGSVATFKIGRVTAHHSLPKRLCHFCLPYIIR